MWWILLACASPTVAAPPAQPFDAAPAAPPPAFVDERAAMEARFAAAKTPLATAKAARAIAVARGYLGTPYRWEGRDTARFPGLDCLGLLFRAWGAVDGTAWTAYPPNPSPLVASGRLGAPVPGLDGVLRADVDPAALRAGDVLYLLLAGYEIPDAPLWTHDGVSYWPWHTAMYVGDGVVIEASPLGAVREGPLVGLTWDALYVTRVPG